MDEVKKDVLKCRDYKCKKGTVDLSKEIPIRTGCSSIDVVFPCSVCGRLHWKQGDPVRNRRGQRAFWENGRMYNLTRKGEKQLL
ncbi:MAG: hypothetical protein WC099_02310 [Candidatus Paceibacterota bacterium]